MNGGNASVEGEGYNDLVVKNLRQRNQMLGFQEI